MSPLTPAPTTHSRAIIASEELEPLAREAQSIVAARSIILSQAQGEPCTLAEADRCIGILAALNLNEGRLNELATRIAQGMRPASHVEIGRCLLLLDHAFYNSRDKGEMSGALMFDEVVISAPGVLVLESAVRKLWRTLDWFPSIAQLRQAIREEEARWQYSLYCVSAVMNEQAKALAKLKKARAWLAQTNEQRETARRYRADTLSRLSRQIRASSCWIG